MAKNREVGILIDAKNKSKGAFVEVKKDLRSLGEESKKGLGKLSSSFANADKVIMSFSDRMKWMDKIAKRTFQGTAAAAGIYVGATLKDFAQLNDGISKVNTLYDQTAESQKKMYQDSIKMFKLIPTNFNKITQGIYDTISAGADPEYATMMARKFGMAGVAGDSDMDVVTKAAMGTMNAYKLEAKDLTKILDLQFMTVKDGITSYSELASSLGTGVLASAKGSGITLEELYGSIAMITKNAIPANIATTSLNQLFNKFTDTKAIKEFKKFGVEIQDAKKNTRPLIEILKDLNAQFDKKKMTSEQRKGYLKKLLGSDEAARAIMPLIGDLKEFQKILGDMDNSSGAMKDAFNDRLESMKTQMQIFWNGLKGIGVEQLEKMNPLIEAITGPFIRKEKLELELIDLEDSIRMDPKKEKIYQHRIEEIKLELDNIDLLPLDDFREALKESVEELNKFSPALGGLVDTLGEFILKFIGEEGKENRKKAGKIGKGLLYTQLFSWGSRKFKNVFGKTPWELASWGIPKAAQFGKGALETGYLKALYGAETLKAAGIGAGTAGIMALPVMGAGAALYNEKKTNDRGKQVIKSPDDFSYSLSKGKWLSKEELEELNKNQIEKDRQNNVTIGPASDKKSFFKKDKAKQDLMSKHKPKSIIEQDKSMLNAKLIDELLKIDQTKQKINNNVSMQSEIKVEPPKVDVNTKVYIDSKNIPTQRVEVDYGKVEKHFETQSRRHGRPEMSLY